jgi:hypothetical protein
VPPVSRTPATPTLQTVPKTEVDIYTKNPPWPYKDPADLVMSPNICGFAWNLEMNPKPIALAHQYGAKFISEVSLWNHDRWRGVEDLPDALKTAYTIDFDGKMLFNQGMVFLNTLDPAFQKWLADFMRVQIEQGVDGFVFDEIDGVAAAVPMGGGLDPFCLEVFRGYLKNKYTPEELVKLGVADVSTFDYRRYLVENNQRDNYLRGDFYRVPLGQDYYKALSQATADLVQRLIEQAGAYARTRNQKLTFTANLDPLYADDTLPFVRSLDYYTFEHEFFYSGWRGKDGYALMPAGVPVAQAISLAEDQGKKAVVLPGIMDFGALARQGKEAGTALTLHAFAETYANMGYYAWFDLDTPFLGMTFTADHARLRPYYQFVREHPEAFNSLSWNPEVAITHPPVWDASDLGPLDAAAGLEWILAEANIHADVIDLARLYRYKVVVAIGYAWPQGQLDALLEYVRNGGTVIAFDGRFASRDGDYRPVSRPALEALKVSGNHVLGKGRFIFVDDYPGWKYYAQHDQQARELVLGLVKPLVSANSAPEGIQLLPFTNGKRYVVHLLNYDWNGRDFQAKKDLEIKARLPGGFDPAGKKLKLVAPDAVDLVDLPYRVADGYLEFNVPALYIWSAAVLGE